MLRTTLLGSLLDAARYNLAHGAERVALFESHRVYQRERPMEPGPRMSASSDGEFAGKLPPVAYEPHRIGALGVGPIAAPSWDQRRAGGRLLRAEGRARGARAPARERGGGRAGRAALPAPRPLGRILAGGAEAGWIGELHPLVARAWDLEQGVAFELDLAPLVAASAAGSERYEDVISYPAVHEDVAVVVGEDVSAEEVRTAVLSGGGELLRSAAVFDVYRGEQLGEGRKSMALRLEFRAADRTLTDEEVAGLRGAIESRLAEIGGALRE